MVEIYAVTFTVSTSGDQGADPDRLVTVRDKLEATVLPTTAGDHVTTMTSACSAQFGRRAKAKFCGASAGLRRIRAITKGTTTKPRRDKRQQ
jgi:hypothetical protein